MSDSDDEDPHLDEKIQQFSKNLERMRKRRRLMELQAEIAEEGRWLQEAQERLDNAQQSVGPEPSDSISHESPEVPKAVAVPKPPVFSKSPAFSVAPGHDTSSAVDALMESVLNPAGVDTALGNNNTFENSQNSQTFAENNPPANSHAPTNNELVRLQADLPAVHQPYIPEHETAASPPIQTRRASMEVKWESPASAVWSNDAAPGSVPLQHTLYGRPYYESKEESKTLSCEIGQNSENTTDAVSSLLRRNTQPAAPWISTQSPARRIQVTPPSPPDLEFGTYRGRRWAECVHYINTLENHFARYPKYYTEARKVELGAKYISPALMGEWNNRIMTPGNTSWMLYCTFLAQQLSRNANHRQAHEGIASASQKVAQPVTHFALWLIQWAPVAPDVSSIEFMACLLRGVLPGIRARAQKSYEQFSDYNSFALYLQEVENSTPSRARFLAKRNNRSASTADFFIPMNTDQAERKPAKVSPAEPPMPPARQIEGLPSTQLPSQIGRRMSPEVLAPRNLPLFSARSWWECKTFMSKLHDYFDKYGDHCKETRKIEIGRNNLSRPLLEKWDVYAAHLRKVTWFAFCIFLVDQVPSEGAGSFKYTNTYQRVNQSVCTFALELLRWAPVSISAPHNRLRHLWDRVLPEIRSRAHKSWEDFVDFHMFVAYLQQVQDSFSNQKPGLYPRRLPPRKRFRTDDSS